MKKLFLIAALALFVAACGKSGSAVANGPAGLMPEESMIVGSIDIPKLMTLDFVKAMSNETAKSEKSLGIKLESLGTVPFFVVEGKDGKPSVALFTKGVAVKVFAEIAKATTDYKGVKIHESAKNDDAAAAEIGGWTVIGNQAGLRAVVDAAQGKNLAGSKRNEAFAKVLGKASGIITLGFIPDEKIAAQIKKDADKMGALADFVKNFSGAAIGVGFADKIMTVSLTGSSTGDAAKAAAAEIMKQKDAMKGMLGMIGAGLDKESRTLVEKAYDSLVAKADGEMLLVSFNMAGKLLENLAAQFKDAFKAGQIPAVP